MQWRPSLEEPDSIDSEAVWLPCHFQIEGEEHGGGEAEVWSDVKQCPFILPRQLSANPLPLLGIFVQTMGPYSSPSQPEVVATNELGLSARAYAVRRRAEGLTLACFPLPLPLSPFLQSSGTSFTSSTGTTTVSLT